MWAPIFDRKYGLEARQVAAADPMRTLRQSYLLRRKEDVRRSQKEKDTADRPARKAGIALSVPARRT